MKWPILGPVINVDQGRILHFRLTSRAQTQRRLDSYSQSIMDNELLITRACSLTRWLSRSKHLLGKQDGRFWKSEATKGLRYFIKIALIFKLCDPYYDFCLDFSFLLFLKFNGLFCFWDFDGLLNWRMTHTISKSEALLRNLMVFNLHVLSM